jgi:hypothetical protein
MKKLLSLTVALTLASFGSVALADDVTIDIKKAGDTMAKVEVWPDAKPTTIVPISFDSGADWTVVKDSYTVSADTEAAIEKKAVSISIGTDGTATFHLAKK